MNAVISVIFSLLMGAVIAFIWEGMDTSIGKIEDVERITNLNVIAHIPLIGPKEKNNKTQKSDFHFYSFSHNF